MQRKKGHERNSIGKTMLVAYFIEDNEYRIKIPEWAFCGFLV